MWVVKQTCLECLEDKTPQLGAALAYYTLFSLAPLTLIVLALIGYVFRTDPSQAWTRVTDQLGYFLDRSAIDVIQDVAKSAADPKKGGLATMTGLVFALVGASGVFAQLQSALNTIWKVSARTGSGFLPFLRARALTFSMVAGILFLLLVSLVLEGILQGFSKYVQAAVPGGLLLARAVYWVFDFAMITLLFAMIFKVLPDVRIQWRDVWFGAGVTAFLFLLGKWLLGLYLASGAAASAYGAASAVVTLMLWIYYSSQIFLFGAELARVWATRNK